MRPAGDGDKLADETGMGEVEPSILEGEWLERVSYHRLDVGGKLPRGAKPGLGRFQRGAINIKANHLGLGEFLGHFSAPNAGATADIQNPVRLAERCAVIALGRDLYHVMLEIEPVAFGMI